MSAGALRRPVGVFTWLPARPVAGGTGSDPVYAYSYTGTFLHSWVLLLERVSIFLTVCGEKYFSPHCSQTSQGTPLNSTNP